MAGMIFSERALQLVAEEKIRTAIAEGEFDKLPGFGKPCPLIDQPYDPQWWVRAKLQREELVSQARAAAGRSASGPLQQPSG